MRTASPALLAYLNGLRGQPDAGILMADCYDFTLLNAGTLISVTDKDVPVVLNGVTYSSKGIQVDGLKYKASVGLDVDQQKITISARSTMLVNGVPFLVAVQTGALDGCLVRRQRAFLTAWGIAAIGSVLLFQGRVSTVDQVGRTSANITVNSDLTLLDLSMPRNLYAPSCVHVLYDAGCGVSKSAHSTTGTVGAGATLSVIPWSGSSAIYAQGRISFTSGLNAGISANVKSATASALTLSYPLVEQPATGDAFTISQGCDHTSATCQAKFVNLANFRGFPYVPPPTYSF